MEANTIFEQIEEDKGFQNKRRALVWASAILIAMLVSGATVMEANTFILRIEFTNRDSLPLLVATTCSFMLIRYYGYAQKYHEQLSQSWRQPITQDRRFLRYDHEEDGFDGVIAGLIEDYNLYCGRGMDIQYEAKFPLRRYVIANHTEMDERFGELYISTRVNLHKMTKNWTLKHFLELLRIEFDHRWRVTMRTREYLDVYSPYVISAIALTLFFYNTELAALVID